MSRRDEIKLLVCESYQHPLWKRPHRAEWAEGSRKTVVPLIVPGYSGLLQHLLQVTPTPTPTDGNPASPFPSVGVRLGPEVGAGAAARVAVSAGLAARVGAGVEAEVPWTSTQDSGLKRHVTFAPCLVTKRRTCQTTSRIRLSPSFSTSPS